jgi:hypothetical protein
MDENKEAVWVFFILLLASSILIWRNDGQIFVASAPVANVASKSNSFTSPSVPPAIEWDEIYGGVAGGEEATSVIQTSDGGYAMVGSLGLRMYPGTVFFVKTDSSGKMEWNQTYDFLRSACAVVQTAEGGYAIGAGYAIDFGVSGVKLVKTDSRGNVQWQQTYYVNDDSRYTGSSVSSMVQTNDGGYALAGSVDRGPIAFNGPFYESSDGFLIKTDSSGRMQWLQTYGEPDRHNVFRSVIQTNVTGYTLGGTTNFNGSSDIYDLYFWLVKTDSNGKAVWNRAYGSGPAINLTGNILNEGFPGDNQAYSIVQTIDGGYAMTGNTYTYGAGDADGWLVKTDYLGNMEWNYTYGGPGLDFANSLIQTTDGGLSFAGWTPRSLIAGGRLIWLVKTNSTGGLQWNQTYPELGMGSYGSWFANCLIETSDGSLAMAGSWDFTSSISYFYLAKTEPFLPPPPKPPPSSPPPDSTSLSDIVLFASLALVAVVILIVVVMILRRRRKVSS